MIASLVSGSPTIADEPKTRNVVHSPSSRPPPSAVDEIAEMVGIGKFASAVKVDLRSLRNCFVLNTSANVRVTKCSSLLVLSHAFPLLQICSCTKGVVIVRGYDERPRTAYASLILDVLNVLSQVGQQPTRQRISVRRAIEKQHSNASRVWSWVVLYNDRRYIC